MSEQQISTSEMYLDGIRENLQAIDSKAGWLHNKMKELEKRLVDEQNRHAKVAEELSQQLIAKDETIRYWQGEYDKNMEQLAQQESLSDRLASVERALISLAKPKQLTKKPAKKPKTSKK